MWMCKHETRARRGCVAMNCKSDLTQSRRGAELWQANNYSITPSRQKHAFPKTQNPRPNTHAFRAMLLLGLKANNNGLKPQMTQIYTDEIRKLPCATTAQA